MPGNLELSPLGFGIEVEPGFEGDSPRFIAFDGTLDDVSPLVVARIKRAPDGNITIKRSQGEHLRRSDNVDEAVRWLSAAYNADTDRRTQQDASVDLGPTYLDAMIGIVEAHLETIIQLNRARAAKTLQEANRAEEFLRRNRRPTQE